MRESRMRGHGEERARRGPRVAMVGLRAPWGTPGGVEAAVGELAPRLAARGAEVTVFCRARYDRLGGGWHRGVRLVDLPTVYTRHLEAFVHTGLALPPAAALAEVVHIHAAGPALWAWLPRLAGRAVVVTVHGLDWERAKWGPAARVALRGGAWSAARFAHRLVVVGRHLQAHFRERHGVEATFIPNGAGAIARAPLAEGGVPGLQPHRYLLYLGRLVPEKRLDRLLDAHRLARNPLPLVVVGAGTHTDRHVAALRRRAGPGVVFAGPRHGRARDALLRHARALALPSDVEGFPLAPLEAMAAGRPVLLSDIPPHRELLAEAPEAGWLVPPHGWAAALRDLAARPDAELARRGAAGAALVADRYSWEAAADRTLAVYREALATARGGCLPGQRG